VAGEPTTIFVKPHGKDGGLGVELQFVQGDKSVIIGKTDGEGRVPWTPASAGEGRLQATIDGVHYVLPITVVEPRSFLGWAAPWLIAAFLLVVLTRWAHRWEKLKQQANRADV
jgi:hypothetical protein